MKPIGADEELLKLAEAALKRLKEREGDDSWIESFAEDSSKQDD